VPEQQEQQEKIKQAAAEAAAKQKQKKKTPHCRKCKKNNEGASTWSLQLTSF
jgi:2'-5' RNA ligase